jgi:hypothetical protein
MQSYGHRDECFECGGEAIAPSAVLRMHGMCIVYSRLVAKNLSAHLSTIHVDITAVQVSICSAWAGYVPTPIR